MLSLDLKYLYAISINKRMQLLYKYMQSNKWLMNDLVLENPRRAWGFPLEYD